MDTVPRLPDPTRRALILVVERNPAVQKLERFLLEEAGFSVEFAADGLMALERARQLQPNIVVTEILVPLFDGLRLCAALKAEAATTSIIVLVFSHLHAEDRALAAGADAFLCKPIDEEGLVRTVAQLLKIHDDRVGG
jgi:CheY-like chemotaxis protein